jgi:hypothetical protein
VVRWYAFPQDERIEAALLCVRGLENVADDPGRTPHRYSTLFVAGRVRRGDVYGYLLSVTRPVVDCEWQVYEGVVSLVASQGSGWG